jgi:hypothetical protein
MWEEGPFDLTVPEASQLVSFFFFFFFWLFETRFLCIVLAVLDFVDQAGLELRNPPASASRVLGLKACATTPGSACLLTSPGVGIQVLVPQPAL